MKTTLATFSMGVASVALLTACSHTGGKFDVATSTPLKAASPAAMTVSCDDMASKFKYDQVRITSSVSVVAGAIAMSGAPNAPKTAYDAPAHCLVKGLMQERKGADSKDYAIGFEMRLPAQWNGRFYHQVNGGLDGVVQPALGALGGGPLTGALHQGFAVISSDAGHNGSQNPSFGADPEARQNYGYGAVAKLTPMAKGLIQTAYGKAVDGKPFYTNFPYDSGISAANWAAWKYQNSQALDPGALSFFFSGSVRTVKAFDSNYDELHAGIYGKPAGFVQSSDEPINPVGYNKPSYMGALQKRGAKMLTYHGVSDAAFSELDTRAWVDRVASNVPSSGNTLLHFCVPGMSHCSGGPATDQFDALTPLVQWVEQGKAPQAIVASVRGIGNASGVNTELPKEWSPTRTRPLCAYPKVATYEGNGSIEDAANFSCQ